MIVKTLNSWMISYLTPQPRSTSHPLKTSHTQLDNTISHYRNNYAISVSKVFRLSNFTLQTRRN